jgi:hypothetical protein
VFKRQTLLTIGPRRPKLEIVKQGLWYLAKGMQASALCVVGYSLYVGVATANAHSELEWLMAGTGVFLAGLLLERVAAGGGGE